MHEGSHVSVASNRAPMSLKSAVNELTVAILTERLQDAVNNMVGRLEDSDTDFP